MDDAQPTATPRPSRVRRALRRCRQAACWSGLLLGGYLLLALLGLYPVGPPYSPAADGVEVFVIVTSVHTDIVAPVRRAGVDWSAEFLPADFRADPSGLAWVAMGWGDRKFYIETPQWADVSAANVARAALWPTDTTVRVQYCQRPRVGDRCYRLVLSERQYQRLCRFLKSSFQRDDSGRPLPLEAGYNARDCFYRGAGRYHLFNTCNCWAGRALRAAGVRTGWYTPFPQSIRWHLPDGR